MPNVNDLRYRMIRQGFYVTGKTFAAAARKAKVSPSMITMVARGQRSSARVRKAIARELGVPFNAIWED